MSPIESFLRYRANPALVLPVLLSLFASWPASATVIAKRDLEVMGWIERVHLLDPEVNLKAKLDTGAETSSLDVEIIKKFREDDKRWVRFLLIDRETGAQHIIVRERVRTAAIVMQNAERQLRPVVRMRICIAGRIVDTEVSLVDRSEYTFPLLLGRKALESFALIDPGNTYLTKPDCEPAAEDGSTNS
jgi:hypothetical protein